MAKPAPTPSYDCDAATHMCQVNPKDDGAYDNLVECAQACTKTAPEETVPWATIGTVSSSLLLLVAVGLIWRRFVSARDAANISARRSTPWYLRKWIYALLVAMLGSTIYFVTQLLRKTLDPRLVCEGRGAQYKWCTKQRTCVQVVCPSGTKFDDQGCGCVSCAGDVCQGQCLPACEGDARRDPSTCRCVATPAIQPIPDLPSILDGTGKRVYEVNVVDEDTKSLLKASVAADDVRFGKASSSSTLLQCTVETVVGQVNQVQLMVGSRFLTLDRASGVLMLTNTEPRPWRVRNVANESPKTIAWVNDAVQAPQCSDRSGADQTACTSTGGWRQWSTPYALPSTPIRTVQLECLGADQKTWYPLRSDQPGKFYLQANSRSKVDPPARFCFSPLFTNDDIVPSQTMYMLSVEDGHFSILGDKGDGGNFVLLSSTGTSTSPTWKMLPLMLVSFEPATTATTTTTTTENTYLIKVHLPPKAQQPTIMDYSALDKLYLKSINNSGGLGGISLTPKSTDASVWTLSPDGTTTLMDGQQVYIKADSSETGASLSLTEGDKYKPATFRAVPLGPPWANEALLSVSRNSADGPYTVASKTRTI